MNVQDSDIHKYNAHFDITFNETSFFRKFTFSVLNAKQKNHRNALVEIVLVIETFDKFFKIWLAQFIDVNFLFENFKIMHRFIKAEIFIECKISHCKVSIDFKKRFRRMRHLQRFVLKNVFNRNANWNYFYTTWHFSNKIKQIFLIFKDQISKQWWDNFDDIVEWIQKRLKKLEDYVVNLQFFIELIQNMKRMINFQEKFDDLRFVCSKFLFMNVDVIVDVINDVIDQTISEKSLDMISRKFWFFDNFRFDFEFFLHFELKSNTYEFWATEIMMKLCRQK